MAVALCLTLAVAAGSQARSGAKKQKPVTGKAAAAWAAKKVVPKKKYVIGVAIPNLPDPAWQSVWYGQQAQGKKLGVTLLMSDAGGYQYLSKQVSQIENFIQRGVDGILLAAVDSKGIAPTVKKACAAGIKVIDFFLTDASGCTTAGVINSQAEIGGAEADYLGKVLHGRGNVVMIDGPAGASSLVARAKGFRAELHKKFPKIKVLAEKYQPQLDAVNGLNQMNNFLQAMPGKIDGVYTAGSALADGVAQALKAKNLTGKIQIATASPNVNTLKEVRAGVIGMYADQQNVQQGRIDVNVMVQLLNGKKVPKLIVPPIRPVTKTNINKINLRTSLPPAGWKP